MRGVLTLALIMLVTACGDPGRATVEDASDARQSAVEAVQAAEQAAKRIETLSQPPGQPTPGDS